MTDDVPLMPEFALAMRGYDRVQVDDYVARYARRALEMRARMEAAEQAVAAARGDVEDLRRRIDGGEEREAAGTPPAIHALGERVGRILQVAWESAEEMRLEAEHTAGVTVSDAQGRATELLEGAEHQVAQLIAEADRTLAMARAQAESIAEEAEATAASAADLRAAESERHRTALLEEIEALEQRRTAAVAGLDQLRSVLDGVLPVPVSADTDTDPRGAAPPEADVGSPSDEAGPSSEDTVVLQVADPELDLRVVRPEALPSRVI